MSLEKFYAVSSRFKLHVARLSNPEQVALGRGAAVRSLEKARVNHLQLRFQNRMARLAGIDLSLTQFK